MRTIDVGCLVTLYYRELYRFAFGLTHSETDAADLTQQTFYIWEKKGYQLRNSSSVKTWLFTTLRREFLRIERREARQFADEWTSAAEEIAAVAPEVSEHVDTQTMLHLLSTVDEVYRVPLILYYLEDMLYKEIADLLEVPIGTVQSRISRGKAALYKLLTDGMSLDKSANSSDAATGIVSKKIIKAGNKFTGRASHLCNHSRIQYYET